MYKLRVGRVEAGQVAPQTYLEKRDLPRESGVKTLIASENKVIKKHLYGKQQTRFL